MRATQLIAATKHVQCMFIRAHDRVATQVNGKLTGYGMMQVATLFKDHPDLLMDFRNFLPSTAVDVPEENTPPFPVSAGPPA